MTGEEFATLLGDFTLSAESGDGARFASHFTEDAVYYDYIYGPHQGRADIAHMMQDLFHRDADGLSLGDVRSRVRRRDGLCVVAVELHLDDSAIQGPARRDRRHEPLHRARRPDRGISRIRQWRRCDGAARRRAGRGWQKCSSAGPAGSGSGRRRRISGAAERLARESRSEHDNASKSDEQGDRRDLSAYSLRGERQDRDHHAQPARPHECVDARSWSATCAMRWRRPPPTTMSASSC